MVQNHSQSTRAFRAVLRLKIVENVLRDQINKAATGHADKARRISAVTYLLHEEISVPVDDNSKGTVHSQDFDPSLVSVERFTY